MKTLRHSRRAALQALVIAVCGGLILCSCSLLGLKRQVVAMEEHGAITVRVSNLTNTSAPTYALAWTRAEDGELESAGFQKVGSDKVASFSLLTNHYYSVGAFTDENQNGKFDAGEPFAKLENLHPPSFGDPKARARILELRLDRESKLPPGTVIEIPKTNEALGTVLNISLGEIASLDDPRFAATTGSAGMWRPLDFLSDNAVGIYFTEAYDAKRTPLILVYGIGGSPQDWRTAFEQFDRSRYQLWFLQYPSGMRLERAARAFANGVNLLRQRYAFTNCMVVAHSMGGLVSMAALRFVVSESPTNCFPHLVTVSTPFGGHKAAELGVRHLSKPVPSWLDVKPESEFLLGLYAHPLAAGTRHDLIYGGEGEDDGTVTISSQLEPRITNHAASVTHFIYGHEQITHQPDVLDKIQQCLQREP